MAGASVGLALEGRGPLCLSFLPSCSLCPVPALPLVAPILSLSFLLREWGPLRGCYAGAVMQAQRLHSVRPARVPCC